MKKHIFTSLLSLFVIVGFTSFINPHTVSAQPVEWEEFDIPDYYNTIAYGGGVYVVVGEGIPMYSSNGKDWKPSETEIPATLSSIAYGDNKFVAVGVDESWENPAVYLSTDGGVTWVQPNQPLPPKEIGYQRAQLSRVAYIYDNKNSKGVFVAVGGNDPQGISDPNLPYIVYSFDGNIWVSSATTPGVGSAKTLAVGYDDSENVVFLSTLSTSFGSDFFQSNIIMSTDNGVNWNYPDNITGLDDFQGKSMSYLNGKFLLGGSIYDEDENAYIIYVMSSSDGLHWEQHRVGFTPLAFAGAFDFAYGNSSYLSLGGIPIYSYDGQQWEFFTPSFNKSTNSGVYPMQLIYAEDSFVLLGDSENGESSTIAFPKISETVSSLSKPSSIFGTRFCSAGVTTFCRPQNGFVNNNPLVNIYTELLGLYQQLLSAMQGQNS
ncbi:MAG: hypothetical protein PHC89_01105 [Candidatus Pacebacteria bacterium]|nr:hypothetical protein [Candidatus Paceibacterota bacterium]